MSVKARRTSANGQAEDRRRQCSSSATTILRFVPAEPRLMRSSCTVTFARQASSTSVFLAKGGPPLSVAGRRTSGHRCPVERMLRASTSSTRTATTTTGLFGTIRLQAALHQASEGLPRGDPARCRPSPAHDVLRVRHATGDREHASRRPRSSTRCTSSCPSATGRGRWSASRTTSLAWRSRRGDATSAIPESRPQTFFLRKRFIQSHFSLVDLFIAPSAFLAQRYVDWGIPPDKIRVEEYGRTRLAGRR